MPFTRPPRRATYYAPVLLYSRNGSRLFRYGSLYRVLLLHTSVRRTLRSATCEVENTLSYRLPYPRALPVRAPHRLVSFRQFDPVLSRSRRLRFAVHRAPLTRFNARFDGQSISCYFPRALPVRTPLSTFRRAVSSRKKNRRLCGGAFSAETLIPLSRKFLLPFYSLRACRKCFCPAIFSWICRSL